jgi:hypothetical protein
MSSEFLASGENVLDSNLGGAWDITNGYAGRKQDLGIARRFGGAAAAYSLRDIGAMNGKVVRVRRSPEDTTDAIDDEEIFSANQVQSGALEDWVNGKLESTLPADVATAAAAYSLRKVKASYSGDAVRIRRSSDDAEVNVAFDLDDKVSTSSSISEVSGTVTDTTLGDFISGTDAFVHTWYDQAGSNNAVQATAAYQPKIAENGALLADGLKFNGSSTSLATGTQVLTANETGSQSIYVLCNVTDGASGYIAGSADDDSGGKIGQSIYYYTTTDVFALSNGSTATNTTVDRISAISGKDILVSFNYSNNTANTLNQNSNQNGYSDGSSAYDFEAGSNFIIGARGGTVQAGRALNGSIQEVIAYDSDQSNNRFKIESNINNYYGLYNDANEVTGAFTSSGAESFTANGTDGFTLTNSTSTAFGGIELNQVLAAGEKIYVSFNLSIDAGANTSPNLNIREGSITGTTASDEGFFVPSQGFNSTVFTSDSGGDARYISFGENDADPSTYTISDFKVSRIARNGFVETWYDQSGNGRDMIQATAGNQPSIVSNGGYMNGVYSEPASNSTTNSNKQYMRITGTNSFACNDFTTTKVGMVAIVNSLLPSTASGVSLATVLGNIRGVQSFPAGALGLQIAGTTVMEFTNYTATNAENKDQSSSTRTVGENVLVGGTMDNRNIKTFTFTEQGSDTDTTTASTDIVLTSQKDFGIFYSTFANDSVGEDLNVTRTAGGYMKEAYILDGDIIDDIDSINLELRQHYNLA